MTKLSKKLSSITLAGACAASVLSVGLSAYNLNTANAVRDSLGYSTVIGKTLDDDDVAADYGRDATYPEAQAAFLNVTNSSGTLLIDASSLMLQDADGNGIVFPVPAGSTIQYSTSVDNVTFSTDTVSDVVVKIVSADEITTDVSTILYDADGNLVVVAQKQLSETVGISVVVKLDAEADTTEAELLVSEIYETASVYDGYYNVYVEGYPVSQDWSSEIVFADNILTLTNTAAETLYIAPYTSSLSGAGFTTEIALNEELSVYSGGYTDSSTGYSPYMLFTDNGTLKIVSKTQDFLLDAFAIPVVEEPEEVVSPDVEGVEVEDTEDVEELAAADDAEAELPEEVESEA